MAQYCPFFKKNYQEIAQDSKIPGYATDCTTKINGLTHIYKERLDSVDLKSIYSIFVSRNE
jgi:hypothetical protein